MAKHLHTAQSERLELSENVCAMNICVYQHTTLPESCFCKGNKGSLNIFLPCGIFRVFTETCLGVTMNLFMLIHIAVVLSL